MSKRRGIEGSEDEKRSGMWEVKRRMDDDELRWWWWTSVKENREGETERERERRE